MSSSRSIPTMIDSLSHLESLPLNILENIFVQSCNCDIPFLSSTLLAALPPSRHVIQKIGLSMLGSHDADVQSDLLKRRFLDLTLYDALVAKLKPPPDESHLQLADGVQVCERLLSNFVTVDGQQDACRTAKYWKIQLLRRLIGGGVDVHEQVVDLQHPELEEVARQGLYEAVENGNLDAVQFFCGCSSVEDGIMIRPLLQPLYTAFVEQECGNKEIVIVLMDCIMEHSHDWYEDDRIDQWIDGRKEADEMRRNEAGDEEGTGVWVGEWAEMVWKTRRLISYEDFVGQFA